MEEVDYVEEVRPPVSGATPDVRQIGLPDLVGLWKPSHLRGRPQYLALGPARMCPVERPEDPLQALPVNRGAQFPGEQGCHPPGAVEWLLEGQLLDLADY